MIFIHNCNMSDAIDSDDNDVWMLLIACCFAVTEKYTHPPLV